MQVAYNEIVVAAAEKSAEQARAPELAVKRCRTLMCHDDDDDDDDDEGFYVGDGGGGGLVWR